MNLFILIFCIKQIRICWFCIWIKVRATVNIWKCDLTRWCYWSICIFFNSFTDNKNHLSTWYTTYNTKVIKIFWALHYRGIHEAVIFWYHIKFNIFMFIAVWSCVWWKNWQNKNLLRVPLAEEFYIPHLSSRHNWSVKFSVFFKLVTFKEN